jgi:hypothetical protein
MSIDAIKQELASLPPSERRQVQALLVALEDSTNAAYRKKLAEKIDQGPEHFASLEELDQRLSKAPDKP